MEELIKDLINKVDSVKNEYRKLFFEDISVVPIPFFGDISNAKIITVGINPSAGELENNCWNSAMNEYDINRKLINYFKNSSHEWFEIWRKALEEIGFSYKDGTAAHIDICPWATKSISIVSKEGEMPLFEKLLVQSLPLFYKVLSQCKNVEFIVLAGAATKEKYLNEFLYKNSIDGYELQIKPERRKPAPYINRHVLKLGNRKIKTLSCSVSPSARGNKKEELIIKIKENKDFFIQ